MKTDVISNRFAIFNSRVQIRITWVIITLFQIRYCFFNNYFVSSPSQKKQIALSMDSDKIVQQMSSIFSIFMVLFYIGIGTFLIFYFEQSSLFGQSLINKETRVFVGSVFIVYGIFRAFKTFFQIKKLFFDTEDNE